MSYRILNFCPYVFDAYAVRVGAPSERALQEAYYTDTCFGLGGPPMELTYQKLGADFEWGEEKTAKMSIYTLASRFKMNVQGKDRGCDLWQQTASKCHRRSKAMRTLAACYGSFNHVEFSQQVASFLADKPDHSLKSQM